MFTTVPTANAGQEAADHPERPAGPLSAQLARLGDPAWIMVTLWARRWLILAMAGLGFLLAVLVGLSMTPKYVSTAQLFIDPRDLRVLQNDVSPNTVGGDPTSIASYLESQARVIASDSIKSRVVERLGLDSDPDFGGASRGFLARLLGRSDAGPPRNARLYALAALDRNIVIRRGERSFVIDISATADDPEKAARIANALAEAYLDDQAAVRSEAAQRASAALTGRLAELRDRLRVAEEKTEKYKEANNIVGLNGRSLREEQLSLNAAQLVAARTRTTEAKAKYDQIVATRASSVEAGAFPEAVASPTMTALRAQLGAARAREADLVSSLGARHPALSAAQSQVRDARRQIADELARIARAAKVEYDRAAEAERLLAERVDELTVGQHAAGRASVQLRELEREVESSRALYDVFLRRARETGELGGIDTTNARIISPAMPPLERSGMSRRTLALIGTVGGGGVGAVLALALALFAVPRPTLENEPPRTPFWRRARRPEVAPIATAEEPVAEPSPSPQPAAPSPEPEPEPPPAAPREEKSAGPTGWRRLVASRKKVESPAAEPVVAAAVSAPPPVPTLGLLPAVRHRRWRNEPAELRSVFQGQTHLVDVVDKPHGGFAEAIAGLRAELGRQGPERRILVLGLEPQAGATTFALNLALDAARSGLPALLVDAGDGKLALTRVFAADARHGLGDVLDGKLALTSAIRKDEGTGLAFLPRAGAGSASASGPIGAEFLTAARRFGPIVIDGGSLRPDGLARGFAEAADDIVLIVRGGKVASDGPETWRAALGAEAGKLRGVVLNAA
ncbi:Wzz domain-containing protein [Hyphomicrobiales bacterium]|nr:Wzz domain-containing protein [Hyphomicrobiales bacterium]CAH1698173.1 Wzz domain-containing protein [Hyphomicrobiales bacterium]CAI0347816.1 Wzz domain-containing protein [Hyphomicrobiales bacterium]